MFSWLISDDCSVTVQLKLPLNWQVVTDCFLTQEKFKEMKNDMHKIITENEGYETKYPHDLFEQLRTEQNLNNRGWLTHGWQKKENGGGCPRDLTTRKRETCCWPGACLQAENGNNSSKRKRGRQQCGNTKTTKHILTTLKAVSCLRKPVQLRKENANGSENQEIKTDLIRLIQQG